MPSITTYHIPAGILAEFKEMAAGLSSTPSRLLQQAISGFKPHMLPDVTLADIPYGPLEPLEVEFPEHTLVHIRRLAKASGLPENDVVMFVVMGEVDIYGTTRRDPKGLDLEPPTIRRVILQLGLSPYTPDGEVAELIADLVGAMSRWQIANGGNPLEIDDLLPMAAVGEGVPHA